MVKTRHQLNYEQLLHKINHKNDPKWIKFSLNIDQLRKIKRFNQYHLLGRSHIKEELYHKWQNLGLTLINLRTNKFTWKPNGFSYFIEQDLCHYMLWYHGTWEGLQDIYTGKISSIFSDKKDMVYWINPKSKRSIENIPHIHFVFPKRLLKKITQQLHNNLI
jgi:hypothetical protein